jgi:hypothetical protein
MSRLLVFASAVILLVFTTALLAVRARLYIADAEMQQFLSPPADCPPPCWEGIRPGITSAQQARWLLDAHPWVNETRYSPRVEALFWRWNGTQPAFISPDHRNLITTHANGLIGDVLVQTAIPLGEILLLLGEPDRVYQFAGGDLIAVFESAGLEVVARAGCPPQRGRLWYTPVQVRWLSSRIDYYETRLIDERGWAAQVLRCGR